MKYYDETPDFKRLKTSRVKTELALSRMENPWGMTEEKRQMYREYLSEHRVNTVEKLIDLNKKELFPLLVKYRVLKRSNIMPFIDYARDNRKNEILFYLMEAANLLRTNSKQLNLYKKAGGDFPPENNTDFSKARRGDILWLGKDPSPWQVLEKKDKHLLLISKYALLCMPYTNFYRGYTTWSKSSVRLKLETELLPQLFTAEEISRMQPVHIDDETDELTFTAGENKDKDFLFLLSVKETEKYMRAMDMRMAPATKRCMISPLWTIFDQHAYWWLRSPGNHPMEKMYVRDGVITSENSIVNGDDCFDYFGVRPAVYFRL